MADLFERIDGLNDRLTPLAGKRRGMRIEAEEWNTLIEVLRGLLDIDRAQEQIVGAELAGNYAPRDHQHLQQVAADWLAAELRASLGNGGGDIPGRITVADLRKQVDTLKAEVGEFSGQLAAQVRRVDQAATSELDRQRQLRGFENRFAGIEDLRGSVTAVNGRLNGLADNIETVLSLRERLTDENGEPIDLAALRQTVGGLQQLRENLAGADGQLLRMRDLALDLAEVRDALGIAGDSAAAGLAGRVTLAVADAEQRLQGDLQQRLDRQGEQLRAENDAAAQNLRTALDQRLDTRFAGQRQQSEQFTASRVGELGEQLGERLAARGDERLAEARGAVLEETLRAARQAVADSVAGLPARIDAALASERETLAARLTEELAARLGERLPGELAAATTAFSERLDGVERTVAGLREDLPAQVADEIATARATLAGELAQQLDATQAERDATIRDSLQAALGQQLRADLAQSLGDLDARIAQTVASRLGDIDARLAASVDRLAAGLPALVSDSLRREIAALNLDARFATLETRLSNQFRAEMRDALASERLRNSADLNNTVNVLRQEIDAARVSATSDAVRLSQTQTIRPSGQIGATGGLAGGTAIIR